MNTIKLLLLMCGSLCCTVSAEPSSSSASEKAYSVLEVRHGKDAKTDLEVILTRTAAIRVCWNDPWLTEQNKVRVLEPEQTDKLMKILWEDCSAVDWKDGEVDYNVLPPLLEFLDIDGKVIGRESAGRICSASMVKMGNNVLQDLVLPDKQYRELNELLKAPTQEAR